MRPTAVLLCVAAAACAGACWWGDPIQQHDPDPFGGPDGGLDIDLDLPDGSIRLPDGGWALPDGGPWGDAGPRDGGPRDAGPDAGPKLVEGCAWDVAGGLARGFGAVSEGYAFPVVPLVEGRPLFAFGPPGTGFGNGAAIYLPSTGGVATLQQQPRLERYRHSAVRLADLRVLYVGGSTYGERGGNGLPATEAEVFDRSAGTWTPAGQLPLTDEGAARLYVRPALVALPDGRAVLVEASSLDVPFRWSPQDNGFTPLQLPPRRLAEFALVALADGRVLLAGGIADAASASPDLRSVGSWLLDPDTGTWTATGTLNQPRARPGVLRLSDGRVLLVGGQGPAEPSPGAELYDPAQGTWTFLSQAPTVGPGARAVLLQDGRVLVTGGTGHDAESFLFTPTTGAWKAGPARQRNRVRYDLAAVDDGSPVRAVMAGGFVPSSDVGWLDIERLVCP